MAKKKSDWNWANIATVILSIGGSLLTGFFTSKWTTNAEMYKVALAGLGDPNTPVATRYLYIDVIADWEGVEISPERRKQIAEKMSSRHGATLETLSETYPEAAELRKKIGVTTFWDNLYGVKNRKELKWPEFEEHSDGASTQQMPAPSLKGYNRIQKAPGKHKNDSQVDQLPGKGNSDVIQRLDQ